MKNKFLTLFIIYLSFVEFSSCTQKPNAGNPAQLLVLAARAAKVIADSRDNVVLQGTVNGPGTIKNATVQVFATPSNGQCAKDDGTINGTPLASTTSDDLGNYSIKYKKTGSTVCVVVTPTGTSQIQVFSPTTKANVPTSWSKGNLMAVINEPATSNAGFTAGSKTVNVNPFTRMTARRFSALSAINPSSRSRVFLRVVPAAVKAINSDKNQKVEFGNNTASTLLDKASEDVENAFFPNRNKNTFSLESADPNSSAMKLKLGTIGITADKLGGAADGKVSSNDLENVINFMEEDFSDGRFDGKKVDDKGKIATMTTSDFGGVVASKQAADDFLKVSFKAVQTEYDSYDPSITSTASDQLFCETDSLDAACSIAVLPGSPPEMWLFDDSENFIDIGDTADMGGVGFGTYGGSQKTWYMTIVNGGGSDLKLTLPLSITGTQFVVTEQPDAIVAAGDATYFTVEFTPAAVTTYSKAMTITSNDTLYSPYSFTFTGSGQDLNTSIALWWSFDAGDATDDGPNGYDGTESTYASPTDDRLGYLDAAFYLDNSNTPPDDINYSSAFSTTIPNITISAWVAPDDFTTGNGNYTIINRGTAATPDFTLAFTNSGNNLQFVTKTSTTTTLNYPIVSDDYLDYWTHITAILSGNQMLLYIDGVLVAQTTCTSGNISNSTNFRVGSKASTNYFSGAVDDVRVYHRALTATQISALYNQD
jgi:hypothetical protein